MNRVSLSFSELPVGLGLVAASTSLSFEVSIVLLPARKDIIGEYLFWLGERNGGGGDSGENLDTSRSTLCMSECVVGRIDRCSRNFEREFELGDDEDGGGDDIVIVRR